MTKDEYLGFNWVPQSRPQSHFPSNGGQTMTKKEDRAVQTLEDVRLRCAI